MGVLGSCAIGLKSQKRMAPQVGLEPTTLRLTAGCSAIELLRSVAARQRIGGRKHRHHIKALSPAKVARNYLWLRGRFLYSHSLLQPALTAVCIQSLLHQKRCNCIYFRGFDLPPPTCYKCPFCADGCSRTSFAFPGPASAPN